MLKLAIAFLVLALGTGLVGFGGFAPGVAWIAKLAFLAATAGFVIAMVIHARRGCAPRL